MYNYIELNAKTYRIIPSQYPPIKLFESCVDPSLLEDLYLLEGLTNPRLKEEAGQIERVPIEDRISGPGTSPIMASFTHCGIPSRFTDGRYGVYYAGLELETAIAETKFWQEQQLSHSNEPATSRAMRVYVSRINSNVGSFVDLSNDENVQNKSDYTHSQTIANELRSKNEYGIYYSSVRKVGGKCIAAFKPNIMRPTVQSYHLRYFWNGSEINHIEKVETIDC